MASLLRELEKGILDIEDLTEDQVQELIGEMAEAAQAWVPLCPKYPGMKGISCEEIDSYTKKVYAHEEICAPLKLNYGDRMAELLKMDFEVLKEYLRNSKNFKTWLEWQQSSGYLAPGAKRPYWLDESVSLEGIDPMEFWILHAISSESMLSQEYYPHAYPTEIMAYMIYKLDDKMQEFSKQSGAYYEKYDQRCNLGLDETGGHPWLSHQAHTMKQTVDDIYNWYADFEYRDYWNAAKIFSRDELYDLARQMGRQLTQGYDLEFETYKRYKAYRGRHGDPNWYELSYDELASYVRKDTVWQNFKKIGSYASERNQTAQDLGVDDILHDPHTIFVTTPRGGLEFLGIFAYANDLEKKQIPAHYEPTRYDPLTIKEDWYANLIGKTWLDNRTEPIKRVVIIDDTIESGEQQHKVHKNIKEYFKEFKLSETGKDIMLEPVEIIHMAACGRRHPNPMYYNKSWINVKTGEMMILEPKPNQIYALSTDENIKNLYDTAILGYETYELDEWRDKQDSISKERQRGEAENNIPTCAFPWSISDATTARYLRSVYGTRWERGELRRRIK